MARNHSRSHVVSYLDDERRAIDAFAMSVFTNPDASRADRDAARRRLAEERRAPDMSKLSTSQLVTMVNAGRTWSALMAVAYGKPYVAPELATEMPRPSAPREHSEPANAPTSTPVIEPELIAPSAAPELIAPSAELAAVTATEPRRFRLADIKALLVRR